MNLTKILAFSLTGAWGHIALHAQSLPLQMRDPLTSAAKANGEADKTVKGGSFSSEGWKATNGSSQIRISLAKPIGPKGRGVVELDVTNWDPRSQYSGDKQQFFTFLTRADGDPSPDDKWDEPSQTHSYIIVRGGTNYIGYGGGKGVGFKTLHRGSGHRSETAHFRDRNDWSKTQVYTFRMEVEESKVRMYLSGSKFLDAGFGGRKEDLAYVFIGRDGWEGTTGALVGPVFKEVRVYGSGGTTMLRLNSGFLPKKSGPRPGESAILESRDLTGRLLGPALPGFGRSNPPRFFRLPAR